MAIRADQAPLSLPRVLAFALAGAPLAMILLMVGTYLPRFYAGHLRIDLAALGLAIAGIRLVDVGLDLLLGWLMDRSSTRLGRFRPWLILSAPILAYAIYQLLDPPPDAGLAHLVTWLLVLYAGYSAAGLSHAAWGAKLSPDYHDRARLFGWVQGVAVLGTVVLLLAPVYTGGAVRLGAPQSMPALARSLALAALLLVPLAALLTPEPRARPRQTPAADGLRLAGVLSPNMLRVAGADLLLTLGAGATAPLYIFFFHDVKGFGLGQISLLLIPYVGAGLVGAPFWARVARAIGKHHAVQAACVGYAIAQTALMALPAHAFAPTLAGMLTVGFTASGFVALVRAMVGDVADETLLKTGADRAGVLYALVILTQKLGSSLTASIVLPILAAVGYDAREGAQNTVQAIRGLEACYLFTPVLLVLAGGMALIGYSLTPEAHSRIRLALASTPPQPAGAAAPDLHIAAE
jgi:Na+/melibiose symporter-like transporter